MPPEREVDLACIGVGENAHIAFNDPPAADFADPVLVKVAELDQICRGQQVRDTVSGERLAQAQRRAAVSAKWYYALLVLDYA